MPQQKKILKNKKLVSYLMDHKHIDQISIGRDWVCITCNKNFLPSEVQEMIQTVGAIPKATSKDGHNYLIFKR